MIVVDSHLHLWNRETPATPWRQGWARHAHGPSFGISEALEVMDEAGVQAAAVMPAAWDVCGNELVLEAARLHPGRFAAFVSPELRHRGGRAGLAPWKERGALGLRVMFPPGVHPSWLDDGTADWLWPAAAAAGLPVMAWAPGHLGALAAAAERHPRLRLIVDHLNLGMNPRADEVAAGLAGLRQLAGLPNLAVKASALACAEADPVWLVGELVAAFGIDRVFWGSDLGRLPCTYREAVDALRASGEPGLEPVLGSAFTAWTGWRLAAPPLP